MDDARPSATVLVVTLSVRVVAASLGGLCLLVAGCSSGHDKYGDPYITDAQGAAVRPGMSDAAAFATLGGVAVSGSHGAGARPPYGYWYPVDGDGDIWWEICIDSGHVTGTYRATDDKLPLDCPNPG